MPQYHLIILNVFRQWVNGFHLRNRHQVIPVELGLQFVFFYPRLWLLIVASHAVSDLLMLNKAHDSSWSALHVDLVYIFACHSHLAHLHMVSDTCIESKVLASVTDLTGVRQHISRALLISPGPVVVGYCWLERLCYHFHHHTKLLSWVWIRSEKENKWDGLPVWNSLSLLQPRAVASSTACDQTFNYYFK